MPITLLDIILLAVMTISGLLAMVRGFMREILSIGAWAGAAAATLYAYPRLLPIAKQYFTNDYVAMAATVGGVFVGTLLIVSILTIRLSDVVLDSRVGGTDRSGMDIRGSANRYAGGDAGSPGRQQAQQFVNTEMAQGR